MVLKSIVAVILLLATSGIGYLMALRYGLRVKQLGYFTNALNSLETYILYYSTPLPLAMKKLSERSHSSISWLFEESWKRLDSREGYEIDVIWQEAINKNIDSLSLSKEDIEIIIDFSKELGFGNKDTQKKHFQYTEMLLKEQKIKATAEKEKNGRMFNRLGVLLGLAIVIILI
ncbi:stage III sporulation protein SpoIIIAB [Wukongibacter baidiensis]|uniref:stage III sporulation protein SpoIIIAB n=1 Tax=Wukongibacter baidiensis TaxID=1723361 RepID=UPI003D7F695F